MEEFNQKDVDKYTLVEPVKLGGKVRGYLLRAESGAEIVWRIDELKNAMKRKSIEVVGLKLDILGRIIVK